MPSVTVRQLCVVFVVMVIVRCSQSFSISLIGDQDDRPESYGHNLFEQTPGYVAMRETRFAAPRGKRQDVSESSDSGNDFIFRAPRLGKRLVVMDDTDVKPRTSADVDELANREAQEVADNEGTEPMTRETRGGPSSFLRIGRAPSETSSFLRIGRAPSDTSSFLRIGRAPSDTQSFLRIGRAPADASSFLRIGRASQELPSFLRIGRFPPPSSAYSGDVERRSRGNKHYGFLRIGRGENILDLSDQALAGDFTPEEIELILKNREKLLQLLQNSPPQPDGKISDDEYFAFPRQGRAAGSFLRIGRIAPYSSPRLYLKFGREDKRTPGYPGYFTAEELEFIRKNRDKLIQLLQANPPKQAGHNVDDDAYFAFPRQGRAMSFYFPRMGRSGDEAPSAKNCCDGLRSVFSVGYGSFNICPASQTCCPGLTQRTKIISKYVLTECAPSEKLENIRELINEDSLQ